MTMLPGSLILTLVDSIQLFLADLFNLGAGASPAITRMTLFSSFCQVDELGLAVDVELAIDAFGVVSGGV